MYECTKITVSCALRLTNHHKPSRQAPGLARGVVLKNLERERGRGRERGREGERERVKERKKERKKAR